MLCGVACVGETLLTIDPLRGYLLQVDRTGDNTVILNPNHVAEFLDATGLAVQGDTLWFTQENNVFQCQGAIANPLASIANLTPSVFATLPYTADGVAVWRSTVYVTCQKAGYIYVFDADTGREITRFPVPGVGIENITVRNEEELWACDRTEQSVYCLDRGTGEVRFSVLTPFENPTGLAFCPDSDGKDTLYVAYAREEHYVRDNPNESPPQELATRDRTFIHPLYFHYYEDQQYALSNGYLIEVSYVEELLPLDEIELQEVEWRIALPAETDRQSVRRVKAIGRPFTEEIHDGQRVAVFKFDRLKPDERHVFGWTVLLEVWSIKYILKFGEVENAPKLPPEFTDLYLIDNDELMMDSEVIKQAAQEAVGTETNILRKVLKIRNYVYDRLSYAIQPHIDTPDVVLQRGTGSCGEYVGLLLALMRLNGVACRTIGRYKCPARADQPLVPLEPDFNHVWIEFYVPGFGWVPMESNPDDVTERGPYPTRFFMGLAWYHTEVGKGITFERLDMKDSEETESVSIGSLALNHIRFKILEELQPS